MRSPRNRREYDRGRVDGEGPASLPVGGIAQVANQARDGEISGRLGGDRDLRSRNRKWINVCLEVSHGAGGSWERIRRIDLVIGDVE